MPLACCLIISRPKAIQRPTSSACSVSFLRSGSAESRGNEDEACIGLVEGKSRFFKHLTSNTMRSDPKKARVNEHNLPFRVNQ